MYVSTYLFENNKKKNEKRSSVCGKIFNKYLIIKLEFFLLHKLHEC